MAVETYADRLQDPISASVRFVPGAVTEGVDIDGPGGNAVGGELLMID